MADAGVGNVDRPESAYWRIALIGPMRVERGDGASCRLPGRREANRSSLRRNRATRFGLILCACSSRKMAVTFRYPYSGFALETSDPKASWGNRADVRCR